MTIKTHHFFPLQVRPWPLVLSLSSFNLIASLLLFFKYQDSILLVVNVILLSSCSFYWWNSYRGEFNLEGKSSNILENGVKIRIILFISSEIFFFFSFFWSYFHYLLSPRLEVGLRWPPVLVEIFDFSNVPLINTLVLMRSGLTVTVRHYYLINRNLKYSNLWLSLTILLGAFFSFLQWLEYSNSFFTISDGNFGTSFFILTGFHGLHVLIGSIFLLKILMRTKFFRSSDKSRLGFELASWYWHFVDVVWIFLYFFLYYLSY